MYIFIAYPGISCWVTLHISAWRFAGHLFLQPNLLELLEKL